MADVDKNMDYKDILIILIPVLIAGLEAAKIILSKMDKKDDTNNKLQSKS
ncbi:MAG TPA: hypothetical protein PL041_13135 [Melioribacteraceae bacterium]|mgnify:CR=1 FL=1|nr:hypothetical protein [Melioribacteraceae bacterium]